MLTPFRIALIIIISIDALSPRVCFANDLHLQKLWEQYQIKKDNTEKTEILFQIGDTYYSENNLGARDSVFQLALNLAFIDLNGNQSELMNAYLWYFTKEYSFGNKDALEYAKRMEIIGKNKSNDLWLYLTYMIYDKAYMVQNKPEEAFGYVNKANYYANILNDDQLKAESLIETGRCQELKSNKIEAFRNYRDALLIANKLNNDSLSYESYGALSDFFMQIKNYEKSLEYKQKQFTLLVKKQPVDSIKLMHLYKDLNIVLFESKERIQGEKIWNQVIDFAFRHNDQDLLNNAFVIYRVFLIDNGLFNELSVLYTKNYPEELSKIAIKSPSLYSRLKAYIAEADKNLDSAAYYYQLSENYIKVESHDNIFIANFYKRYGQFLWRTGNLELAKTKFLASCEYARKARYFPYIIDATQYLDSISFKQQDIASAYTFEKENRAYTDSQAMSAKDDELLLLEIDNENRQHEILAAKEKDATDRRHKLQDVAIIIFISTLFTVLVMLGSLKVPKWVIKTLGFVSFILLFEFIVILTDTQVENYTHGEPWKILFFKLIIISILAPIHHRLEHLLINYLYQHKILDPAKMRLRPIIARLRQRIKAEDSEHKESEHHE